MRLIIAGTFWAENLVKHRKKGGKLEYEVKWLDYPTSDNTWEKEVDIGEHHLLEYWRGVLQRVRKTAQ